MPETATIRPTEKCRAAAKAAAGLFPQMTALPGVRAEPADGTPIVAAKGAGAILTDVDGNEYVDHHLAGGSLLLGHADDRIVAAIGKAVAKGYALGAPTEAENRLAELVIARLPSVDKMLWTVSAHDAVALGIAVARRATGRAGAIAMAGSTPVAGARDVSYNDPESLELALNEGDSSIAAVVIEPVATHMGIVPAEEGYLPAVARLCKTHGALLIIDESKTIFRLGRGGGYAGHDVAPDLVCLGSSIGGAMPMGALAGRRELMDVAGSIVAESDRAPYRPDAISLAAGAAMVQATSEDGFYEKFEALADRLESGLRDGAVEPGVGVQLTRADSMLGLFFADAPVRDLESARCADTERADRFRRALEERGVLPGGSEFIEFFLSAAHDEEVIDRTIAAAREGFRSLTVGAV